MDVSVNFGLSFPLNEGNIFNVSKECWLLSQAPIPDGPLKELGRTTMLLYAQKVCCILQQHFPKVRLVHGQYPRFYRFMDGANPVFSKPCQLYQDCLAKLPDIHAVTLKDACEFIEEHPKLWDRVDTLDLAEMLRDKLDARTYARLSSQYEFLGHSQRG